MTRREIGWTILGVLVWFGSLVVWAVVAYAALAVEAVVA